MDCENPANFWQGFDLGEDYYNGSHENLTFTKVNLMRLQDLVTCRVSDQHYRFAALVDSGKITLIGVDNTQFPIAFRNEFCVQPVQILGWHVVAVWICKVHACSKNCYTCDHGDF